MDHLLLLKLEMVREKMIRSGMENGLQAPKTIQLSKELDVIMNQYEQSNNESNVLKKIKK